MYIQQRRIRTSIFLSFGFILALACSSIAKVPTNREEQTNNASTNSTPSSSVPTATEIIDYTSFSKNGLAFQYPVNLFDSIQSIQVQAEIDSPTPHPAYAQFNLNGYPLSTSIPDNAPFIMIFSTDEYREISSSGTETVNDLKNLKPGDNFENLAFPRVVYAGMLFSEHSHIIEFKNGKGYAQITQYAQDSAPITNSGLVYTFAGLTNNGALIVAIFPVNTPELPQNYTDVDANKWQTNYPEYLSGVKQLLHSTPTDEFTPSLDVLDKVISSFNVVAPVVSAPFTCPKAPNTQIKVGDKAKTIQATTRLRSKPEVNDNNITFLLAEGDKLEIIGGPVCSPRPNRNDFYVFWKVAVPARSLEGWVAEGDSDNYYIVPYK